MGKEKTFFENKAAGFYFMAANFFMTLATAVVYAVCYSGTEYISWIAFILLFTSASVSATLTVLKIHRWAPVALAVLNFIAMLFYIYGIYLYVAIVIDGIDLRAFGPEFILCSVLFVLLFACSNTGIYLKQEKRPVLCEAKT